MYPITGYEYKNTSDILVNTIDFFLKLEIKENDEIWGILCDKYGYRYVYSLPIVSPKYKDGFLDKESDKDWHACFGCSVYNKIIIKNEDLKKAITKLMSED